jgi:hypothetical protein
MNIFVLSALTALISITCLAQCRPENGARQRSAREVRKNDFAYFTGGVVLKSKKPPTSGTDSMLEKVEAYKIEVLAMLNELWMDPSERARVLNDEECLIVGEVCGDGDYIMSPVYMAVFGDSQDAVVARLPYGVGENVTLSHERLEIPFDIDRALIFRKASNSNQWTAIDDSPRLLWRKANDNSRNDPN